MGCPGAPEDGPPSLTASAAERLIDNESQQMLRMGEGKVTAGSRF